MPFKGSGLLKQSALLIDILLVQNNHWKEDSLITSEQEKSDLKQVSNEYDESVR